MFTVTSATPRFRYNQMVRFIGGFGTVKSSKLDSGAWTYAIEMEMGPEPEVGRIGYETTVMLQEADILGPAACSG